MLNEMSSTIIVISVLSGSLLWIILKKASRLSTADDVIRFGIYFYLLFRTLMRHHFNSNDFYSKGKLIDWWTIYKIKKWKNRNQTADDNSDERLDNKAVQVFCTIL